MFGGLVNGWVGSCEITKILINLDLIKRNSILFEDFGFVETPSPMGGYMGGWVDGWVNG